VGQHTEQFPILLEDPPDTQGHGEDPMPMTQIEYHLVKEPLHPGLLAFLTADQANFAFTCEVNNSRFVALGTL